MKLEDCEFNVESVHMRPRVLAEAEPEWKKSRADGEIPEALFDFYRAADYFSYGKAPPFLADTSNLLFGYLGLVVGSLRECLAESAMSVKSVARHQQDIYTPLKKVRGETWDPEASGKQQKAFKELVLALSTSLDLSAEVVALLFAGSGPNLSVGRASFTAVRQWLEEPLPEDSSTIVSPTEYLLRKLHISLSPLVPRDGSDKDWVKLLWLYRNKLAHLGYMFQHFWLQDRSGQFYGFLPRKWPFVVEEHFKTGTPISTEAVASTKEFIENTCIHVDIVQFSGDLRQRVSHLLQSAFVVLCEAYAQFRDFPLNQSALKSLERNSEQYEFRSFGS